MSVLVPEITQLHMVNGEAKAHRPIPGVYVQTMPRSVRRGREGDVLLLHVTVSGPSAESQLLQTGIIDKFQETYYRTPGGITTALRRAVNTANQHLLEHNLRHNPAAMRTGALCGAVLRGDELHLIQVGETQAYIGHNFGLEAVPAVQRQRLTPLGEQSGVDVRMFHTWLQEDETLLLLDPRLIHLDQALFSPILVEQSLEEMGKALTEMLTNNSARLILAKMVVVEPPSIVELPRREPARMTAVSPDQADRNRIRRERRRTVIQRTVVAPPKPEPVVEATIRPSEQPISPENSFDETATVSPVARGARNGLAAVLFGLSNGVRGLARMLSGANGKHDARVRELWLACAMLFVTVLSVSWIVGSVYFQRERAALMLEIKHDIRQAWNNSERVGDSNPNLRRVYYDYILYQADVAAQLVSNDSKILEWRSRVQTELDKDQGMLRLAAEPIIDYGDRAQMRSVALGGAPSFGIYGLDDNENAVYLSETRSGFDVSGAPRKLIAGEAVVGTHLVGDIIDIGWRERNVQVAENGIALLDRGGALVTQFAETETRVSSPLGFASQWVDPVRMVGYAGRVYVLDRGSSADDAQIWRYLLQGTGLLLDNENPTIKLPDLHLATDFVIMGDGTMIVTYEDGRIRQYTTVGRVTTLWDETSLAENGLLQPLVSPQAIYVTGAGLQSAIYVLDPGSSRLVKLSIGGTLLAQYRSTTFGDVFDLFANTVDFVVEDTPLRVYALTEDTLYVAEQP